MKRIRKNFLLSGFFERFRVMKLNTSQEWISDKRRWLMVEMYSKLGIRNRHVGF
jgi:hypothetical protein